MKGLIECLKQEISELSMLGDSEEFTDEILLTKKKIEICENIVSQTLEDIKAEEKIMENDERRNLIYAFTKSDVTYLQNDVKSIPEEYYEKIIEMLERLEYDDLGFNSEKVRKLRNNKKIEGVYELKEFKLRLIYRVLDSDSVYVMMVRMKKDDLVSIDKENIIERNRNTDREFNRFKEIVKNPLEKEKLVNEHQWTYVKF